MAFTKATRRKSRARILIEGPSGSGKSYGALLLAKGLGGRIAAIDTEHGSLSMYDNVADFDVMELAAPFTPQRYIQAIKEAEEAGYDVLIIDSITHEWSGEGGCLDILEKTPAPGGNQWGRWATVTPLHQRFIEAMLQSSLHVVATVRSKTEYVIDDKNKPKKAGTAPQQRDGMDYEFTMVFSVQADNHVASVTKDRTAQFGDYLQVIDEKTGRHISEWLNRGADAPLKKVPEAPKSDSAATARLEAKSLLGELAGTGVEAFAQRAALIVEFGGHGAKLSAFDAEQCAAFVKFLQEKKTASEDIDTFEETAEKTPSRRQKAGAK